MNGPGAAEISFACPLKATPFGRVASRRIAVAHHRTIAVTGQVVAGCVSLLLLPERQAVTACRMIDRHCESMMSRYRLPYAINRSRRCEAATAGRKS
jgi:hypothetical protein